MLLSEPQLAHVFDAFAGHATAVKRAHVEAVQASGENGYSFAVVNPYDSHVVAHALGGLMSVENDHVRECAYEAFRRLLTQVNGEGDEGAAVVYATAPADRGLI